MNQTLREAVWRGAVGRHLGSALAQEAATGELGASPAGAAKRAPWPQASTTSWPQTKPETWFISKVMVSTPVRRGGFYTVCMQTVFVPRGTYSLPAQVERQIEAASGMANQSVT